MKDDPSMRSLSIRGNHDVPPEVRAALMPLARFFVTLLVEAASEHAQPTADHYTAKTAPMPRCTFRRLCRQGVFARASCVGGEWRAPRADVDAWIGAQPKPRAMAKKAADEAADAAVLNARTGDELLAQLRAERGRPTARKGKRS